MKDMNKSELMDKIAELYKRLEPDEKELLDDILETIIFELKVVQNITQRV